MTKHIAGFILFSMIVGVSVFFAVVTGSTGTSVVTYSSDEHCDKKKRKKKKRRHHHRRDWERSVDIKPVVQAVFNQETGLLTASIGEPHQYSRSGEIILHFFAKDRFGTRFLKTERLNAVNREITYLKEMPWLKRIDRDQNIFVMTGPDRNFGELDASPMFVDHMATPVIMSEK